MSTTFSFSLSLSVSLSLSLSLSLSHRCTHISWRDGISFHGRDSAETLSVLSCGFLLEIHPSFITMALIHDIHTNTHTRTHARTHAHTHTHTHTHRHTHTHNVTACAAKIISSWEDGQFNILRVDFCVCWSNAVPTVLALRSLMCTSTEM